MIRAFFFGIVLLSSTWAAASGGTCELAALPTWSLAAESRAQFTPEQLVEKVAATYLGLLEFAGDEYSKARLAALMTEPSLHQFFEPVPVAEQRSVALNDAMKQLGNWVLFESENQGVELDLLRLRLCETVRVHVERLRQEQARTDEVREENRETPVLVREFAPHGDQVWFQTFVGTGSSLITGGRDHHVYLWNTRTLSPEFEFEFEFPQDLLSAHVDPQPFALPNPDHFLVAYLGSNVLEIWNWRTRARMRRIDLAGETVLGRVSQLNTVSPSGRYFSVDVSGGYLGIVDLETGQVVGSIQEEDLGIRVTAWSPDSSRLAVYLSSSQEYRVGVWEGFLSPVSTGINRVFFAAIDLSPGRLFFGTGTRSLILGFSSRVQEYLLGERELVPGWSVLRSPATGADRLWDETRDQILSINGGDVQILSRSDGSELARLNGSVNMLALRLGLSPSGRLLAVGYGDQKTVQIWDLLTRKVRFKIEARFGTSQPPFEFSADDRTLLVRGREMNNNQVWNLEEMRSE